jgi:hypothetical protein
LAFSLTGVAGYDEMVSLNFSDAEDFRQKHERCANERDEV